jgi:hypothetical protein
MYIKASFGFLTFDFSSPVDILLRLLPRGQNMPNRIIITGATGFIGRPLTIALAESGHDVIALTRSPARAIPLFPQTVKTVKWDSATPAGWSELADGAFAVINLAGENIGSSRWSKSKKRTILQSRLSASSAITYAIHSARQKPKVLIQASGIGYYGDRGNETLDEASSLGPGFLADIARQWEQSVQTIPAMGVRLATIRLAVVLGKSGGVIPRLVPPFRFFLGGHPGSGNQWLPWIHLQDVIAIIRFLIETPTCSGPFNVTTPHPILSKDFYNTLGRAMHRPAIFPMPAFALRLILGEMATDLLLPSQKALPKKLIEAGYNFNFPNLTDALKNILT